jgi:hypothetical protein
MAERKDTALLGWLKLLGWTVVIERDGGLWVGLARRVDGAGDELCVGGSAPSYRELVSKLFNRALRGLAVQAA